MYRYEQQFQKAWNAYAQAEQIFEGQRNWAWLGAIYQEQAICLFQATSGRRIQPVAPGRRAAQSRGRKRAR